MGTKEYCFPLKTKENFLYDALIQQNVHIVDIFQKYADKSCPQSPRHILYLITRQNGSLFESTNSEFDIKASPKSSKLVRRIPSLPSLRQSEKIPGSPSEIQKSYKSEETATGNPSRTTALRKSLNPTKAAIEKANPTTFVEESTNPSEKSKIPKKFISRSPTKELKRSAVPIKDDECTTRPIKRPKLSDGNESDVPEFVISRKTAETFTHSDEEEKMDVSPHKSDETNLCQSKCDKENILSPGRSRSSLKMESLLSSIPIMSDGKIEINIYSESIENSSGTSSFSSTDHGRDKLEELGDEAPDYIKIRKIVDDRIKAGLSLIEAKRNIRASEENTSNRSPRRSSRIERSVSPHKFVSPEKPCIPRKFTSLGKSDSPCELISLGKSSSPREFTSPRKSGSPQKYASPGNSGGKRKEMQKISGSDDPEIKFYHPQVSTYLKMRFSSILFHRNEYMSKIRKAFEVFQKDVKFLYTYAKTILTIVEIILIEEKYVSEDLKNLKYDLIKNSAELSEKLREMVISVDSDIPFWDNCLKEIQKLQQRYEPHLSVATNPEKIIEYLRKYESHLKKLWEKMDRRIFLRNGLRTSLLETSVDYVKLTRDFPKFLAVIEILRPCSSSEDVEN